jgi:hypothetical protein
METSVPPNLAAVCKKAAKFMFSSRQITGMVHPTSTHFNATMIDLSVNLEFFM